MEENISMNGENAFSFKPAHSWKFTNEISRCITLSVSKVVREPINILEINDIIQNVISLKLIHLNDIIESNYIS